MLRDQWRCLRGWLADIDVLSHAAAPSGLGDWSVADLVAHLGLSMGMLAEIRPAAPGAVPLTLADYVEAYPAAADQIADRTRELTRLLEPDLLAGIDAIANQAWAALGRCDAAVVQGRRGPLSRSDAVTSRLIELVVHAGDLAAALGRTPPPILSTAEDAVADALGGIYRERTGHDPVIGGAAEWIPRATGREADPDPHLPLL